MGLAELSQVFVNALLLTGILALVAVGFSLVWGIMNIVNLAHGAFIVLGAYLTFGLHEWKGVDPFLSIPLSMADTSGSDRLGDHRPGGAYVTQHLAVAGAVIDHLTAELGAAPTWQLVYQSRSGPPSVPWLEPDINEVIDDLVAAGRRAVIVVPIGFVSDHVEVVWDLDNEAAETAARHGLFFARVRTPGTDPRFVAELADLVAARLGSAVTGSDPLVGAARRPDFCAARCCVNVRATRPTTAADDSAADWSALDVDPARLVASGIRGTPNR